MINSTSKTDSLLRQDLIAGTSSQKKSASGAVPDTGSLTSDSVDSSGQDTLQTLLKSQPEVRSDVVALGQKMVVDANYPPKELIRRLSAMLVNSVDLAQ